MCLVALRLLVCLHNCFSGCECEEVHVQLSQAQEWELAQFQTARDSPLAERRDVFTAHDVWVHIKHVTRCSLIASGWRAFSQHHWVRRRRRRIIHCKHAHAHTHTQTHTHADAHTHTTHADIHTHIMAQTWQTPRWQRKVANVYVRGVFVKETIETPAHWLELEPKGSEALKKLLHLVVTTGLEDGLWCVATTNERKNL